MILSFSLRSLERSSLGDSSTITKATMESGSEVKIADLLVSSSVSSVILCEFW